MYNQYYTQSYSEIKNKKKSRNFCPQVTSLYYCYTGTTIRTPLIGNNLTNNNNNNNLFSAEHKSERKKINVGCFRETRRAPI